MNIVEYDEYWESHNIPLLDRDISWLSFNARVLQEAEDHKNPLYERIKFLAIYSSNLGEFFAVRIAQHRNLVRIKRSEKKALHINPTELLEELLSKVNRLHEKFTDIFNKQIVPELAEKGIRILRRLDLNTEQQTFVENYFDQYMLPYVQPVLLIKNKVRPFLNNSALYLSVMMKDKDINKSKLKYGIVKIPSDHLPRFISLPSDKGKHDVIFIDDVVRHSISFLFPGYEISDTFSVKLTRDAELYIDDEFSGDLVQKIKESLLKRDVGPASRLVYDQSMPEKMLNYLVDVLNVENHDLIPEGRYHNNFDLFSLPNFGKTELLNTPLEPLPYSELENAESYFEEIRERDHLIMMPYHKYQSVVEFFEQAAKDPNVTHIKITQYRVARESEIMEALMEAAEHGKNVSAFVEVKARFDEEANLRWGEKLQESGVKVRYSFPGLKVHAKTALVRRVIDGQVQLFAYMSTGNFHEKTSKIYSDFGFFTADERITSEVARLFSILETETLPEHPFEHLLVGKFNQKEELIKMTRQEIENAKQGLKAEIFIKVNSLQDREMIDWLYQASNAGVKIRIICRGICCLIPGLEGWSENIEIISIVDRYLEHARIFAFHNNGDIKLYLSSADWMQRNLNYRIETTFPIYDPQIKQQILDILYLQWSDNTKARIVDEEMNNNYRTSGEDIAIQSQIETYYYLKRKAESNITEIENAE